jgi:hypothetical protein
MVCTCFLEIKASPSTGIRTPVRPATSLVAFHTGADNIRNAGVGGKITLKHLRTIGCEVTQQDKIRAIKSKIAMTELGRFLLGFSGRLSEQCIVSVNRLINLRAS